MSSSSVLVRCAFIALMLGGLVALADSMARAQLARAVEDFRGEGARAVVSITNAAG